MAEERVQRRLAAILAADVSGYSRLMGEDEAETRARFNGHLETVIKPAIENHQGRLVKTMGDGFLVEFSSVVNAVQCAADIQCGVGEQEATEPDEQRRMLFRIGIHLGDVIIEDTDIHGDGVNVAARLEAIAEPGGICVSDMVRAGVRNKLALDFLDLGDQTLKNIAEPVHAYKAVLAAQSGESTVAAEAIFRRPAVVVLPFENLSGDPEQDYFADGLTEDIITALSLWRSFPVIARNSAFAYKGKSPDIRQVGRELGARYVIEGSVRKSGERIRVTAQLINSENGHHVWAERYDRKLEDIFELQDEITQRIAATIEPALERAERTRTVTRTHANLGSWDCYQRGMSHLFEFSPEETATAREMFHQAITMDPNNSQAFTGLAYTHQRDLFLGNSQSRKESLAKFFEAVRQAIAIDDSDSEAHRLLGHAYAWDGKPDLALAEHEKALEYNPNNWIAHIMAGVALKLAGKPQEAISRIEKGLELNPNDPRSFIHFTHLADVYLNAGRFEDAVGTAQTAIRVRPDYLEAHIVRAAALGFLGRVEQARQEIAECRRIDPDFTDRTKVCYRFRSEDNIERLFDGLRKAGLPE